MRHSIIAITFLLFAITGYHAVPLDDVRDETKNNNITTITVKQDEKPVILETSTLKDELISTSVATTTDKIVEVKVLETSSTSSTSVKSEPPTARTTKSPPRTRTTQKAQKPRRTTLKPGFNKPSTRDEWLKLIENEMAAYDKKSGHSPIANKNLTIISERILKYLVENGTQIGISLREQKDGTIKYMKTNSTIGDKIYGEGTESKFPPVLEFVVQRIQSYFSVYAHEDHSRPARPAETEPMEASLREEPDDDDDEESSTLSNDQVIDQLQDELSEFIGSDAVKNVTEIKLPSLIKSAYEKFSSWFVPSGKPSAKEEPTQESAEDSTETTGDKKPEKKPSIIKGAYDALEAILSVFDDIDVSDEEEKAEAPEEGAASDAQLKESQDDLEETEAIKETVGENLYDFLKLAYTLYDADES